ncbi:MAG: allantoinase AllB [Verrucomicrobium sp.]|nr:allantoinase AllB [Verrucomicrobium sp.]
MNGPCDVLLRGGTLADGSVADVAWRAGRIVAVAPSLDLPAARIVDAGGAYVLPGFIDAHVHFNEPGRAEWEGLATGSAALAAGGGSAFFDMPLNSTPPVLDGAAFDAKAAALARSSRLDAALWGGLTPLNLKALPELAARGAIGFKAFLSDSGLPEFPAADAATLREGMARAAELGLPVAVHAEDEATTRRLAEAARAAGKTGVRDYLASRPPEAEVAAIEMACSLARETGCSLHIVHVSTAAGLDAALRGGATAETCPHYLLLTEEDMAEKGPVAKCAPPLRAAAERDRLWQGLAEGKILTVGSDHSPAPPEMKRDADFFAVWGGISGCQHAAPLFLQAALDRGLSLAETVPLLTENVARRFRLAEMGRLEPGFRADVTVLRPEERRIEASELLYRHRQSPYVGVVSGLQVVETFCRGVSVHPAPTPASFTAQLLRPTPLS